MYGIIDIGSNTMRLSCYRVVERELIHVFHKKSMAGLASYVDNKNQLTQKGIAKAIETLQDFQNIVTCVGMDKVYIIATASFRNVANTREILQQIFAQTGLEVQVLTGGEEAMYDLIGATYQTDYVKGMVVDIGGGSTELACFEKENTKNVESIPIGSLNLFSRYVTKLFPTEKEEAEIRKVVRNEIAKLDIKKQSVIIGVGGTNRACCRLYNDYYEISTSNIVMESEKITAMLRQMNSEGKGKMRRLLRIVPERIHTIIPGMIIMDEINQVYKCGRIEVSSRGVREGYLINKVV